MASRWRHCADLTGPRIEPQTSRTDGVRLTTELTGRCSHVPPAPREKELDCFTRKASKGRFLLLVVWAYFLSAASMRPTRALYNRIARGPRKIAKRSTVGPWLTSCRALPYQFNRTGASHLHDLPFEHGMKSSWRLVVCCIDRELADLKYQKKKLNQCEWHIPEARKSLFAGFSPIADPTLHYSQSFA